MPHATLGGSKEPDIVLKTGKTKLEGLRLVILRDVLTSGKKEEVVELTDPETPKTIDKNTGRALVSTQCSAVQCVEICVVGSCRPQQCWRIVNHTRLVDF